MTAIQGWLLILVLLTIVVELHDLCAAVRHQPVQGVKKRRGRKPLQPHVRPPVTVEDVVDVAAEYFGVSRQALVGDSRVQPLASYRHIAIAVARDLTDAPLAEIGGVFGNRNHSTILHSRNAVEKLDAEGRAAWRDVEAEVCHRFVVEGAAVGEVGKSA